MKVKFESLDNCNYAVEVGNSPMNLKLVGIQGSNLLDGNKTYTLGKNFILYPVQKMIKLKINLLALLAIRTFSEVIFLGIVKSPKSQVMTLTCGIT